MYPFTMMPEFFKLETMTSTSSFSSSSSLSTATESGDDVEMSFDDIFFNSMKKDESDNKLDSLLCSSNLDVASGVRVFRFNHFFFSRRFTRGLGSSHRYLLTCRKRTNPICRSGKEKRKRVSHCANASQESSVTNASV
jgi:hypothetical protein